MTTTADRRTENRLDNDSTAFEDMGMALSSVWIVVAVHLDGRAHWLDLPDSFFTWWHGLLYGGLGISIAWLVAMGVRRRSPGQSWLRAAVTPPRGYRGALVGAAVFAAGGAGDLVWHSIFGIEAGIDALLSPTHLLLFVGATLLFSGPVFAARSKQPDPRVWPVPTLLAVAAIAAVAAFALSYLSAFTTDAPLRVVENFPEGTPEHAANEAPAVAGVASYLLTSLILVLPLAYLVRSSRLPAGAITVFVTTLAALALTIQDFSRPAVVIAVAAAGIVADIIFAVAPSAEMSARARMLGVAIGLPILVWSAQIVALQVSEGVRWSPELVVGSVLLSALVSAGLVLVFGRTDRGAMVPALPTARPQQQVPSV